MHSPLFSNPPEVVSCHPSLDKTAASLNQVQFVSQETEAVTKARYAVLSDLPIPPEMPNDMLVPIIIPTPNTLQDFLGTASGVSVLTADCNHRIFTTGAVSL